ncbi:MAG TPA: ThiF family adenylyltransferase [Anaeromyxobacteraceae bacterium]|nr:ThiF family adenylyltransferase [Anaeromyxobacteraceae bacterium]
MSLSEAEVRRYARQLILPAMGEAGQERLRAARVRVVGAGLTGGPAIVYLAQAGVGTLWIDDPDPVGPEDLAAWIYPPADVGRPRGAAAAEAARAASALVRADILRPGAQPTALLVCPGRQEVARAVAEEARLLGLAHVVAEADGEGGSVTVVPPGAPCYACAFRAGHGAPPQPAGAAAVGALAALELVMMLSGASQEPRGRRIDLVRGQPVARATSRLPGCACGRAQAAP